MAIEEMMPRTLMEMMMVVVVMVVMRQSVATDSPLLVNVLLNTSQWGHRSPHAGSQLQFQTQKLQATEHVSAIPVNRALSCYFPFPFTQRQHELKNFFTSKVYKA
jgi:hypothetical protein